MTRLLGPMFAVAVCITAAAGAAQARAPGENTVYAYAQVLRVTPVYTLPVADSFNHCAGRQNRLNGIERNRHEAAMLPRDHDGSLRSHRNRLSAPDLAPPCPDTAIGMRLDRRLVGYDVEYVYKGDKFMSRLERDPGNRLRVRVSVVPDAPGADLR